MFAVILSNFLRLKSMPSPARVGGWAAASGEVATRPPRKGAGWVLAATSGQKRRGAIFLYSLWREQTIFTSALGPPEAWENTCLLF